MVSCLERAAYVWDSVMDKLMCCSFFCLLMELNLVALVLCTDGMLDMLASIFFDCAQCEEASLCPQLLSDWCIFICGVHV